jgi:hypothetical protein
LEAVDLNEAQHKELRIRDLEVRGRQENENVPASSAAPSQKVDHADSFQATLDEEVELRKAGVVSDYNLVEDKFPPNNRTLENFFRGAWTYHIHNQVSCH